MHLRTLTVHPFASFFTPEDGRAESHRGWLSAPARLALLAALGAACAGPSPTAPTGDLGPRDSPDASRGAADAVAVADTVAVADAVDAALNAPEAAGPMVDPPAAPGLVEAAPGDGRVLLRWAVVPRALRYAVRRARAPGTPAERVGETLGAAFLDVAVENGVAYRYTVAGIGEGGEGAPSPAAEVTPDALPGAVTGLRAVGSDARVSLTWTAAPRASMIRLRRTVVGESAVTELGPFTAGEFTDTAVRNGTRYRYTAAAVNGTGEGPASAPAEALPVGAPEGLTATPGNGRVDLSWALVTGATGYAVEAATGAAGAFTALGRTALARLADTGLTNGALRSYRVAAVTPLGMGPFSPVVGATPSATVAVSLRPEDTTRGAAGINTWFLRDWSGDAAFVDVFKQSRPWQDGVDWHRPVAGTDPAGWPTADASTVLFSGDPADFNGTYRLVFEGRATVSVMWAPGSVDGMRYDADRNVSTADVTFAMAANGSVGLVFRDTRRTATSALGTGFANARLYRPGYPADGSVVFTRPFVEAIGRGRVVRHMDWTDTNQNTVQRWEDRARPGDCTQADRPAPPYTAEDGTVYRGLRGVAIEHQIQLCNAARTDCWFNLPALVDDGYVRNLALAIRYGTDGTNPYAAPQARPAFPPLDPDLRVYLEYGNENWNSGPGFLCFRLIQARCAHLPDDHPVRSPATTSIYTLMWRYPAWRTVAAADTFRAVFGPDAMLSRVRPVLMTQIGNAQATLSTALTWLDPWLRAETPPRAPSEVLYGAGGSAYYGVEDPSSAAPDRFLARSNYPEASALRAFTLDTAWTAAFGLRHVAYEGGPGLSFSAGDNRRLNADPRMYDLMLATHDAWSAAGGDLLVYYTLRGPSEWEFTSDIRATETPKLRALTAVQERARAAPSLGPGLPGVLVARDLTGLNVRTGAGYDTTVDGLPAVGGLRAGDLTVYLAHAPVGYAGSLRVTGVTSMPTRLAVWINGRRQGEVTLLPPTSGWHLGDTPALPVTVPAGTVAVRLEVIAGDMILRSISL